jgi:hypothetical protein
MLHAQSFKAMGFTPKSSKVPDASEVTAVEKFREELADDLMESPSLDLTTVS